MKYMPLTYGREMFEERKKHAKACWSSMSLRQYTERGKFVTLMNTPQPKIRAILRDQLQFQMLQVHFIKWHHHSTTQTVTMVPPPLCNVNQRPFTLLRRIGSSMVTSASRLCVTTSDNQGLIVDSRVRQELVSKRFFGVIEQVKGLVIGKQRLAKELLV